MGDKLGVSLPPVSNVTLSKSLGSICLSFLVCKMKMISKIT